MIIYYVYKLLDENNNIFYIGKGTKKKRYNRIDFYIKGYFKYSSNNKLKNKLNKLISIFKIEIIRESSNEIECLELEKQMIKEIGLENLCNLTEGGEGVCGFKHSKEHNEKIRKSKIGKKFSKETRNKITRSKLGLRYKLDGIGGIENIIKLYEIKNINEISEILNISIPTILKYLKENNIYVKNKNRRKDSEETRNKKSKSNLGKTSRPVLQYNLEGNFINSFLSIKEACIFIGKINRQADISCCCRGKQKTAFGYIWKYKK